MSCSNEHKTKVDQIKIESFKIIIEDDSTSIGTRNRYTLTNNSFEHRYLKDELIPNDTVMQELYRIEANAKLLKISTYDIKDLKQSDKIAGNSMLLTLIKNGKSKTVRFDENPDDFICCVISYINELSVEKYQLTFNCKK